MNYEEIKNLLLKYGWVLESQEPLNIHSNDGIHAAYNYAAEIVIEYLYLLDQSDDEDNKQEIIDRFNPTKNEE